MAQKKFANPADDILAGITVETDKQNPKDQKKEEEKNISTTLKNSGTEEIKKNQITKTTGKNNNELNVKVSSSEKKISKVISFSLDTSLRMEAILRELKTADPDNARKYSKVFFINEAIMKSINDYEKKLGLK